MKYLAFLLLLGACATTNQQFEQLPEHDRCWQESVVLAHHRPGWGNTIDPISQDEMYNRCMERLLKKKRSFK